jgi:hypothetical protein
MFCYILLSYDTFFVTGLVENGDINGENDAEAIMRKLRALWHPPPPSPRLGTGFKTGLWNRLNQFLQLGLCCRNPLWSSSYRISKSEPVLVTQESIPPAYVAWRAGTANRVVVPAPQAGNRFLRSLKGLQIWALVSPPFLRIVSLGIWTCYFNKGFSLFVKTKICHLPKN